MGLARQSAFRTEREIIMMRGSMTVAAGVLLAGVVFSGGCADPHYGLRKWQIADLRSWESEGQHVVEEKKPETATALGFFLGFGGFYTNEPVLGVFDLLVWPWSILWEPWIAPALANEINYEATKHAWEHRQRTAESARKG